MNLIPACLKTPENVSLLESDQDVLAPARVSCCLTPEKSAACGLLRPVALFLCLPFCTSQVGASSK